MKLMKFPVHQLLIGSFFVLTLYYSNMGQLTPPEVVLKPLALTLGLSLALWGILTIILRNIRKAALITSCAIVFILTYGYTQSSLLVTIPWAIILILGLVVLILRKDITVPLNIIVICLVLVPSVGIIYKTPPSIFPKPTIPTTIQTPDYLPDIYYIIPDEYSGQEALLEFLNFDNEEFINYLSSRDFYIISNYYGNYPSTGYTLSSTLNVQYFQDLNPTPVLDLIRNSEVSKVLREVGYKYIQVGSGWFATTDNPNADLNLTYSREGEFDWLFYQTTVFYPLLNKLNISAEESQRQTILYQFRTLTEIPKLEEPTFTEAHIMLPHGPAVFNADGSPAENLGDHDQNYLNQLLFCNTMLERTINSIIDNSGSPPIIIIQSDTGALPYEYHNYKVTNQNNFANIASDGPELIRERLNILGAFYLPGFPENNLVELNSPVNMFRIILNYYLGTNYEVLPDHYYWFLHDPHPTYPIELEFIDITEVIKHE